jgi:hypothetical protein
VVRNLAQVGQERIVKESSLTLTRLRLMKNPLPQANRTTLEPERFQDRTVDFSKMKTDLSVEELRQWVKQIGKIPVFPPFFFTIETLSPAKTIGRGRTNLTLVTPTLVQTDATTPYASFDLSSTPSRNPTVQMHFETSAYGITSIETYFMQFTIETAGQSTFNLSGYAGAGTVLNAGTKVLNGLTSVTLVMQNVPPSQQTYGFLEQTAGGSWTWYSTLVRFPPVVFEP